MSLPPDLPLTLADGSVTIQVIAHPGHPRSRFLRFDSRGFAIALKSPPEKGRANRELLDFLAVSLDLPRSAISLLRGATGRLKTVRIMTANPVAAAASLRALVDSTSS